MRALEGENLSKEEAFYVAALRFRDPKEVAEGLARIRSKPSHEEPSALLDEVKKSKRKVYLDYEHKVNFKHLSADEYARLLEIQEEDAKGLRKRKT